MPKLHVNNTVKLAVRYACWSNCMLVICTCRGYCYHKNTGAAGCLQDLQSFFIMSACQR